MLKSVVRMPAPRRTAHWARLLRGLWTLPTNAIGHAFCAWMSKGERQRVGGPAGAGWIYPRRRRLPVPWFGAVTLGHAILYEPGLFDGPRGRVVLAHELAHTRQHDVLGPAYLPLHLVCQGVSLLIWLVMGERGHSPVHDYNPLEQTFICLAAGATDAWPATAERAGVEPRRLLAAFGL